jgi:hypothetical protein
MSLSVVKPNYHFFSENGAIKRDNYQFASSVSRWFKLQTTSRSYDILKIFKLALENPENGLTREELSFICSKAAQKLQVSQNLFNSIAAIAQMDPQEVQGLINPLSDEIIESASNGSVSKANQIKNIQKLFKESQITEKTPLDLVLEKAFLKARLKEAGLDASLADDFPSEIDFLIKTRLIYSIAGLQNSTADGKEKHPLIIASRDDRQKELMIKKEGVLTSVTSIKNDLSFDKKENMLVSKDNPDERWNYFNEGLVPIDRFYHHDRAQLCSYPAINEKLHPVTELSKEEMQRLLAHATSGIDHKEDSRPLNAVVQFITNPRLSYADNPLMKNFDAQVPVHCGIRVITSDAMVYSTGFGSTLDEDKYNTGLTKYLGSINGQPTNIDYEEFRTHEGRLVTSIAVNQENAQAILNQLNTYRKEGIRFNILKQNCMKLGTNILSMTGEKLDIRVSLDEVLYRCLPDPKSIPFIGSTLSKGVNWIKSGLDSVSNFVPNSVKKICNLIKNFVFFIPRKLGTFFKNILVLILGGRIESPVFQRDLSNQDRSDDNLEDFECLLTSMFDDEATDINHSSVFINWQLNQASSMSYDYEGKPNMNIVPDDSQIQRQTSEEKIRQLKEVYKYSISDRL